MKAPSPEERGGRETGVEFFFHELLGSGVGFVGGMEIFVGGIIVAHSVSLSVEMWDGRPDPALAKTMSCSTTLPQHNFAAISHDC